MTSYASEDRKALEQAIDAMRAAEAFADQHADSPPAVGWDAWQCIWNGTPYPPGRNDLPACLYDLWSALDGGFGAHSYTRTFYAHAVADAWLSAEVPGLVLDREDWLSLWMCAGYSHNGMHAPRRRRRRPVRLYRVALPAEADNDDMGLSWTSSIRFARRFHALRESRYRTEHRIFTALVAPEQILGEMTRDWTGGRGEPEIIADMPGHAVTSLE